MTASALLEAELLPCPFCGGEAKYWPHQDKAACAKFHDDAWHYCRAQMYGFNGESAVILWNRRGSSLEGQAVRCDAIPKHDWQELSCEPGLYEPSMESGYKRCKRCGTRAHFIRERTDQSKDKPA